MLTNVYIDGFNLYHRALQREPRFKWLDLAKLCRTLLLAHEIRRIRYFTAIVQRRPEDPQQQRRQLIYLRALRTIPTWRSITDSSKTALCGGGSQIPFRALMNMRM